MALESNVEQTVAAWAENNGWETRKMAYAGRRGCRDRDFYGYGSIVLIEFKQKGKPLRIDQEKERYRLARAGVTVHVIDTVEAGIALLQGLMGGR